jgi:hypothetical protein
LAAIGSGTAGLEVMVGMAQGAEGMVVDAADYGEYSAAAAGVRFDTLTEPVAAEEDRASADIVSQLGDQVRACHPPALPHQLPDQRYDSRQTIYAAPAATARFSADDLGVVDDQDQNRQQLLQQQQQDAAPADVLPHRCADWTEQGTATSAAAQGQRFSDDGNQTTLSTSSLNGAASAAACGKVHLELTHGFSMTATASS